MRGRMQRVAWCVVLVLVAGRTGGADETPPKAGVGQLTITAVSASAPSQPSASQADSGEPTKVSMDFQDANVKDVLKIFSKQTGVNVIAREDVGDRKITLFLEDVSILDALDQILKASDLIAERPRGSDIYIVRPKPQHADLQQTETRVYRLRFARVSSSQLARAVEALSAQTPFEAKELTTALSNVNAGGSSTTSTSGTKEIGIDKIVEKLLTDQGKLVVDERTNSLIVTELPENFPRVETVLTALDIKTAQIMIEAEVLETTLARIKDLGVEWGADSEGTIGSLVGATKTTRFPFSTFFGAKSGTATGVNLGTISAAQTNALLQALERDTDTKILARPKVLTLENESAVIRLTSQQAVALTTTTVAAGTGITQTAPERMTTGVILSVTPTVNEHGYVTMLVEPSVTKTVPSEISSSIVDPKTRSARALVRIRQGNTLVLGGLIDRSERDVLQQVPILSGIPIIGEVFKNREKNNTATELIVFITPRILSEGTGRQVSAKGQASLAIREQEQAPSRQEQIEDTLQRLEKPRL